MKKKQPYSFPKFCLLHQYIYSSLYYLLKSSCTISNACLLFPTYQSVIQLMLTWRLKQVRTGYCRTGNTKSK